MAKSLKDITSSWKIEKPTVTTETQEVVSENMDTGEVRKLYQLAQSGLLDVQKLPLLKRALNKSVTQLTLRERTAMIDTFMSLLDTVLGNQPLFQKTKTTLRSVSDKNEETSVNEDDALGVMTGDTGTVVPGNWDMKKDPPPVIMLRRRAIRVFPGGSRIALYLAPIIGKYISIPYGPVGVREDIDEGYIQSNPSKEDVESRTLKVGRKVRFNSNHPEYKGKRGTITDIDHDRPHGEHYKVKLASGEESYVRDRNIHVIRDTSKVFPGLKKEDVNEALKSYKVRIEHGIQADDYTIHNVKAKNPEHAKEVAVKQKKREFPHLQGTRVDNAYIEEDVNETKENNFHVVKHHGDLKTDRHISSHDSLDSAKKHIDDIKPRTNKWLESSPEYYNKKTNTKYSLSSVIGGHSYSVQQGKHPVLFNKKTNTYESIEEAAPVFKAETQKPNTSLDLRKGMNLINKKGKEGKLGGSLPEDETSTIVGSDTDNKDSKITNENADDDKRKEANAKKWSARRERWGKWKKENQKKPLVQRAKLVKDDINFEQIKALAEGKITEAELAFETYHDEDNRIPVLVDKGIAQALVNMFNRIKVDSNKKLFIEYMNESEETFNKLIGFIEE